MLLYNYNRVEQGTYGTVTINFYCLQFTQFSPGWEGNGACLHFWDHLLGFDVNDA